MNSKAGQLVLETLIAITVTSLVLVGLLAVISRGVKNTDLASQFSQASSYAEEGLEMARRGRDGANTWSEFTSVFSGDKGLDSALNWGGCTSGNVGIFTRCVNFNNDTDKSTVTVTVSWEEGGRPHQVQATTFLTNWSK